MSEQEASLEDFTDREDAPENNHITGFGTFPDDWWKKQIEECAKIRDSERIPLNRSEREEKKPGDIPYYGANGVVDYINEYIFDSELVLLAEDGGHFEEYQERPVAYRISGKAWVNNHAHILEAKDSVATDYLFYSLEHRNLVPYVSGSTRSKLTQTMLKRVAIPAPPLEEQRKIASVLYTVDKAIQKTEDVVEQIKTIQHGIYQDLFRNSSDDTAYDPFIGEYPESWELKELSEITTITDAEHFTPDYTVSGIPVIRPGDLSPGRISFNDIEKRVDEETYRELIQRYTPTQDDIVYSRSQSFAVASRVREEDRKYCIGQDMVVIGTGKVDKAFLLYLLNSPLVRKQAIRRSTGSTFSRVNLGDIRSYIIPVPEKHIQREIGEILTTVENQRISEEKYHEQLQCLKEGLMQDLLSGQVRTHDKDIAIVDEVLAHG